MCLSEEKDMFVSGLNVVTFAEGIFLNPAFADPVMPKGVANARGPTPKSRAAWSFPDRH